MPSKRQLFLNHIAQTSPAPLSLEIEKAEGIYLYDSSGKKYLDLIAGIGVSALGHGHPAVVNAVKKQADAYLHTLVYGEFILNPQVQLAELLTSKLPKSLNSVYLVNSGSEAIEGAMKLAKRHTGRSEIISCKYAYHGSTHGAASLMWPTEFTAAYFPLLPDIAHISYNCIQCLEKITDRTACVVVETVQAESGVTHPIPAFLKALRNRCSETGTLLILDEVQAGLGRCGSMFAFENYDIVPDILVLAKGLGGGMPIGAFVADSAIMRDLSHDPVLGHITTFGGHPVSCAASFATLSVLCNQTEIIAEVNSKAALFKQLLNHDQIVELRNVGLLMAVDLGSAEKVQHVIAHCLENGLVTDWFLFNDRSLRIAPPLIITEDQINIACKILLAGLDSLEAV